MPPPDSPGSFYTKVLGKREDASKRIFVTRDETSGRCFLTVQLKGEDTKIAEDEILRFVREAKVSITEKTREAVARLCASINEQGANAADEQIAQAPPGVPVEGEAARWAGALAAPGRDYDIPEHEAAPRGFPRIMTVQSGQPIAVVRPLGKGRTATDISAGAAGAATGECPKPGQSVRFNPKEKTFFAEADGRVRLRNNELTVEPFLEACGDQEVLSESIRFHGTVHVKGNVLDDFEITCTGEAIVDGDVDAARIVTLQSAVLHGDFTGKIRGSILAGEDVAARNVADAVIHAGRDVFVRGNIEASEVKCLGEIHAAGSIRGGVIVARRDVRATEIGAPDGTKTFVVSGHNYLRDTHEDLMRIIADRFSQNILKVKAQLDGLFAGAKSIDDLDSDKRVKAQILMQKLEVSSISLESAKKKLAPEADAEHRQTHSRAGIIVLAKLYAGAEVTVGGATRAFDETLEGPILLYEDEERLTVAVRPLASGNA